MTTKTLQILRDFCAAFEHAIREGDIKDSTGSLAALASDAQDQLDAEIIHAATE